MFENIRSKYINVDLVWGQHRQEDFGCQCELKKSCFFFFLQK